MAVSHRRVPGYRFGRRGFRLLVGNPQTAVWLEDGERKWLVDTLKGEQIHAQISNAQLLPAFANARIWLLALVFFGVNACGYGVTLWLPKLIHSRSEASNFMVGLFLRSHMFWPQS